MIDWKVVGPADAVSIGARGNGGHFSDYAVNLRIAEARVAIQLVALQCRIGVWIKR